MTIITADHRRPLHDAAGKPKILVVEDNYLTAEAVCHMVRECGYAVAGMVGRVESGLDFLANSQVDAALVDINLAGVTSFPLCAELRRRRVPFTFLTSYAASIIPPVFRDAPLLAKPVDKDQVRSALATLAPARRSSNVPDDNLLLRGLADPDLGVLQGSLEKVSLAAGDVLERPGQPASHVVFPASGAVSVGASSSCQCLEVALVGREGLVGIAALLGGAVPSTHAEVLFSGSAWRISSTEMRELLRQSSHLQDRLLRYVADFIAEVCMNALAMGRASIEQRLARWLLMLSDRLDTEEFPITHDWMATVLGVRRASITVALHELEGRHVIRSRRRRLRILSRPLLIQEAGGFYGASRPEEGRSSKATSYGRGRSERGNRTG